MKRLRADLALVLVTVIWGSTFVVVSNTLDALGPLSLVALRFWVASLGLLIPVLITRPKFDAALLKHGLITGAILVGGFVTQTMGLQTTEPGKAAFITGLNVPLVPIISAVVFRNKPKRMAVLGVVISTIGMALLTLDGSLRLSTGDLWVLACALFYALHIIITGQVTEKHDPLAFTFMQMATVAGVTTVGVVFLEANQGMPSWATLGAIVYLGLPATALVYGLQTWAQRHTSATHTALIFALEPVFAALFAMWLVNEVLVLKEWLGGAMILVGMLIAELDVARKEI